MPSATVTSKGQITIPVEVRRRLRLHAGAKVQFVRNDAGETVIRAKTGDIRNLFGCLKYDGPPLTIDEMNEAIARHVVQDFKRAVS